MKTCTRPDWSSENNDFCICDDPESFEVLYDSSCEDCIYFREVDE